jgi:hypothetical protein
MPQKRACPAFFGSGVPFATVTTQGGHRMIAWNRRRHATPALFLGWPMSSQNQNPASRTADPETWPAAALESGRKDCQSGEQPLVESASSG